MTEERYEGVFPCSKLLLSDPFLPVLDVCVQKVKHLFSA